MRDGRHDRRPADHLDGRAASTLEADVTILQNTQLHGATHIAEDAEHRPGRHLRNDSKVGEGATVIKYALHERAEIGPDATSGRSPTCGPAPCSATAARSAPTSR